MRPSLAILLVAMACGGIPSQAPKSAQKDMGMVRAALVVTGPWDDVMGILFEITCSDGTTVRQLVPLEHEGMPPWLLPEGAGASHAFADFYQVLPAGECVVTATPMKAPDVPSEVCSSATQTVTVHEGTTVEIVLVLPCKGQSSGGLDTVAVLDHPPVIGDLHFDPSKFVDVCQPVTVTVGVIDPDGDSVSYDWSVVGIPDGAVPPLVVGDGTASIVLIALTPGDYTLEVRVLDPFGLGTSLTFPVHVSEDLTVDYCSCCVSNSETFTVSTPGECIEAGGMLVPSQHCQGDKNPCGAVLNPECTMAKCKTEENREGICRKLETGECVCVPQEDPAVACGSELNPKCAPLSCTTEDGLPGRCRLDATDGCTCKPDQLDPCDDVLNPQCAPLSCKTAAGWDGECKKIDLFWGRCGCVPTVCEITAPCGNVLNPECAPVRCRTSEGEDGLCGATESGECACLYPPPTQSPTCTLVLDPPAPTLACLPTNGSWTVDGSATPAYEIPRELADGEFVWGPAEDLWGPVADRCGGSWVWSDSVTWQWAYGTCECHTFTRLLKIEKMDQFAACIELTADDAAMVYVNGHPAVYHPGPHIGGSWWNLTRQGLDPNLFRVGENTIEVVACSTVARYAGLLLNLLTR